MVLEPSLRDTEQEVNSWRWRTFEELIRQGVLLIGDGYRAKHEELGGAGPIFLRAGHVRVTHIDFAGAERFREELTDRVRSKLSAPGDVIITTKGNSTGRTAFVRHGVVPFVYSPHLSFWRSLDNGVLEPGFLRAWSNSAEFRSQLHGMSESTDMAPYLSLIDQRRLRIRLPPIRTQRAIASILGALDDKIDLNRRMNETLEEMARTIFRSWFVDFEPVRAKAEGRQPAGMDAETAALFPRRFVESELGEIPEGWEIQPLDAIATFQNGLALQKYPPSPNGERLPVIKISHLRTGGPDGKEWATADIRPECIIEDGDVVFSWSGSLMVVLWCGGRGALNQHLFKVTSTNFPKWFYLHHVLAHLPEFQWVAAGKATTMGHIQRHHLHDALCVVPPGDLLMSATKILEPILQEQVRCRLESRTLASLRDTLLPKLISGELRVPDVEKLVEAVA